MANVGGEVFISGAYSTSYNSVAVGITEGDAGLPTISQQTKAEEVNNTSR